MTDIAEILKNYAKGTKLYSPICGECELDSIEYGGDIITVVYGGRENANYRASEYEELDRNHVLCFDRYGKYESTGEVMLFPSKNCRDWSTMKVTQNCNEENNNTKNSKEENRQKFKKGDFLKDEFGNIFICNEAHKTCWENEYLGVAFCVLFNNMMFADKDWIWRSCLVSYATEEEKQKLLKAIDEKGYIWDSEKLELIKKEPEFKVFYKTPEKGFVEHKELSPDTEIKFIPDYEVLDEEEAEELEDYFAKLNGFPCTYMECYGKLPMLMTGSTTNIATNVKI